MPEHMAACVLLPEQLEAEGDKKAFICVRFCTAKASSANGQDWNNTAYNKPTFTAEMEIRTYMVPINTVGKLVFVAKLIHQKWHDMMAAKLAKNLNVTKAAFCRSLNSSKTKPLLHDTGIQSLDKDLVYK